MKRFKNKKVTASTYDEIADLSFEEKCEWLYDNYPDVVRDSDLADMAKNFIDRYEYTPAIHLLEALRDDDGDYYLYDYNMGTLQTPSSIRDDEDVQSVIDLHE